MLRRIIASLTLLLLVACGGTEKEATPKAEPTKSVQSSTAPNDSRYLRQVRSEAPDLSYVSDDILVGVARESCSALDDGESLDSIFATVNELTTGSGATILGAGIFNYCPEHAQKILG